jgi:hypothetical protein
MIRRTGTRRVGLGLALALTALGTSRCLAEEVESVEAPRIEDIQFRVGDPVEEEERGLLLLSFSVYLSTEGRSSLAYEVSSKDDDEDILARGDLLFPEEDGIHRVQEDWPMSTEDCGTTVQVRITVFGEDEKGVLATSEVASVAIPEDACEDPDPDFFE